MVSPQACADVVAELRRTTRAHRLVQRRMSHEHLANVAVLALVDAAGGLRSGDIAEQLLVDTSVASRQVATLVHDGLLDRVPDPDDGRSRLLHLTDAGRQALDCWRRAGIQVLAQRLDDWTDDEVTTLARLLKRFNDSTDASTADDVVRLARPTRPASTATTQGER